jgi:hypothetical protein
VDVRFNSRILRHEASTSSGSSIGDVTFNIDSGARDEDDPEVVFHSHHDPCFSPEAADTEGLICSICVRLLFPPLSPCFSSP